MRNALHVYLFSLVLLSYMVIVYSAKLKKIEKMMQQAQADNSGSDFVTPRPVSLTHKYPQRCKISHGMRPVRHKDCGSI